MYQESRDKTERGLVAGDVVFVGATEYSITERRAASERFPMELVSAEQAPGPGPRGQVSARSSWARGRKVRQIPHPLA